MSTISAPAATPAAAPATTPTRAEAHVRREKRRDVMRLIVVNLLVLAFLLHVSQGVHALFDALGMPVLAQLIAFIPVAIVYYGTFNAVTNFVLKKDNR